MPDYEDYYEVSNYGRVKSVRRRVYFKSINQEGYIKERILSQSITALDSPFNGDILYYLNISFVVNGHRKVFRTARLVYRVFVKKFNIDNRSLVIQYKDGNGLNIFAGNLELNTVSHKQRKVIAEKRTPRLTAVTQFNLKGERLDFYESMHQAARAVDGHSGRLYCILQRPPFYYKGYLWRKGNRTKTKPLLSPLINYPKALLQYNSRGKLLKVFPSLTQAAKEVGATNANLRKVLNGQGKSCKGFIWKWKDMRGV